MLPSRRSSLQTRTDRAPVDRGSITPFVAVFLCVALSCCAAVVRAGTLVINGERAQSAADSVALAYVMRDDATARGVAAQLGVRITAIDDNGTTVSVTVESSHERRTATAMRAVQETGIPVG